MGEGGVVNTFCHTVYLAAKGEYSKLILLFQHVYFFCRGGKRRGGCDTIRETLVWLRVWTFCVSPPDGCLLALCCDPVCTGNRVHRFLFPVLLSLFALFIFATTMCVP